MTKDEVENATLEAIFWWNSTESNYHNYFSRMDDIYYKKPRIFEFFITKTFEIFLREYSVRRNIRKNYKSVDLFIKTIIEQDFVTKVRDGKTSIVDELSEHLSTYKSITNNRQTRSLLSKIAFLINPTEFSLFDNLAKQSLWEIIKKDKSRTCKKKDLEAYSIFLAEVEKQIDSSFPKNPDYNKILLEFEGTNAHRYFKLNKEAFKRRIYDKYLWLQSNNKKKNSRKIINTPYKEFLKLQKK